MVEVKIAFNAADDYERFMGRWSRAIGERFLDWFVPPAGAQWLDLGCGTGAFSELILKRCAPKSITGIDPAPAQIDYVRKHLSGHTFEVADSMALPFDEATFDVVASALVFHFIPDRRKAFAEMQRVLRPGGVVGGYTWKRSATTDFAPYVPMLRAAESFGAEPQKSTLVPEASAEGMRATFATAGFIEVAVTEIEVTQSFESFEEFWEVQTLPFSPPGRTVAQLDDAKRARLRDMLRETMPAPDGSVTYPATAVAGKAHKPD